MAKICNNCGTNPESKTGYDLAVAVCERTTKRLWIALILAILMIFASNAGWLIAWYSYDYSSEEVIVEQDASDGGDTNFIGNDGDIINGSTEGNN